LLAGDDHPVAAALQPGDEKLPFLDILNLVSRMYLKPGFSSRRTSSTKVQT